MSCPRCGSDRLFQFEANPDASKNLVTDLPQVCRECGLLTVQGVALQLPSSLEDHAKQLVQAADQAGQKALQELTEADRSVKIKDYFAKTYKTGYLDGFLRCLAYHRHNNKEGKVKRLRELWQDASKDAPGVQFDPPAFDEFQRLLTMGSDAASS